MGYQRAANCRVPQLEACVCVCVCVRVRVCLSKALLPERNGRNAVATGKPGRGGGG